MNPSCKKESIKKSIATYIDDVLESAEEKGSIDFFKIEINNHNGTLQIDHKFRSREKLY